MVDQVPVSAVGAGLDRKQPLPTGAPLFALGGRVDAPAFPWKV